MSETKKVGYNDCLVAYREGDTNIISLLHPETKTSIYFEEKTLEDYQEEYPGVKIYTWDEVMPLLEKAQNETFCGDFHEITKEEWWDMYEVLPPKRTVGADDLFFGFLMSEYMTSNITGHYYKIQDRYFSTNRRDTDNPMDHYKEIMEQYFIKKQD